MTHLYHKKKNKVTFKRTSEKFSDVLNHCTIDETDPNNFRAICNVMIRTMLVVLGDM